MAKAPGLEIVNDVGAVIAPISTVPKLLLPGPTVNTAGLIPLPVRVAVAVPPGAALAASEATFAPAVVGAS